jgi:uncharacterized membrane protein
MGGGALVAWGLSRRSVPALAMAAVGGALVKRGATGRSRLYRALGVTALPERPALARGRGRAAALGPGLARPQIERSVTIARPREEIYALLRDPARLLDVVPGVTRFEARGEGRAQWLLDGGAAWEAELVEARENERLCWRATDPSAPLKVVAIDLAPAPGGRGTEVRLTLEREPPRAGLGVKLSMLAGKGPDPRARSALRRLKQLVEAGEIPTIEGQPSCRRD